MFDQQPQPTPEQIAQRLYLMDIRLDQHHPGYLTALEQLKGPQTRVQREEWHVCRYGSDNERKQP